MNKKEWEEHLGRMKIGIKANEQSLRTTAQKLSNYHMWIGIPTTAFTALAGATLLTEIDVVGVRIAIGIIALLAAVLSGVMTFVNYGKRSEEAVGLAAKLSEIRHAIELLEKYPPPQDKQREELQAIYNSLGAVEEKIPASISGGWQTMKFPG